MPNNIKPTKSKPEVKLPNQYYRIYTYKENEELMPLGNGSDDNFRIMDEFNKMLYNHQNDKDNKVEIISDTKYKVTNIRLKEPYFYELIDQRNTQL